jgi:dienelactone hydrolase
MMALAASAALLGSLATVPEAQSAESISGTRGRYAAVMEMDTTLPDHTVYRPADLSKVQGKLPVVSFGNGGCVNIGSAFKPLLGEVASHGYLAIATGPIGPEPAFPAPPAAGAPPPAGPRAGAPPGGMPFEQSKTESLVKAIDWAIAENARKSSPYYGRIDTTKIAVAGQSCGGLQAIAVGADPRVTTVLVLNSGIIRGGIPTPDGGTRQPAGYLPASDADLPKLHTPMLYLIGGEKDQAYRGAEGDFEAIQKLPVFNANTPVGHGGTWREPGGGAMGKVAIDWLNWRLKGDAEAAKTFNGDPCGLCNETAWTVKRKNWK